ncbi:uncharacterized protein CDV56_106692 [Aspergillus thermomutatus]|uniref:Uncharacterized protein n=1 Tax=Aspergillus thermomutatus TaxID=41047 RepID=A0A397GXQ8_ASPTH|nr:uncharacterized protein CDV56_106692 [Aspergillus thermomutatus]RHZ52840.1 hypothetical protein CDV56_106692 [Aspergillus thermomutatus]
MDEHSHLYEEIHDLTTLISLIFKRPPYLEDNCESPRACGGDVVRDSSPFDGPADGENEGIEPVDETGFEDEIATGWSEAYLATLKPSMLDRLAEMLARFKTTKNGKARGKATNSDAKHVTSVAMLEDHNHERVAIFCSKNEGLDADDERFLKGLSILLKNISGNRDIEDHHLDSVFDIVFNHQVPRVKFYSAVLQSAFNQASQITMENTLTEEVIEHKFRRQLQPREWEGLRVSFNTDEMGETPASEEAVDWLSGQATNTAIAEVFQKAQRLFGSTNPSPFDSCGMKSFLRTLYAILRHPKQRPALKNSFRQPFHGNGKIFRRAWDTLLFLDRIFHAAVTFVEFASNK